MPQKKSGVTLLELLLVMAIIAILGGMASTFLFGQKLSTELEEETKRVVGVLRTAQNKAMTGVEGSQWGVHFDNTGADPFYDLFWGTSYAAATTTDRFFLSSGTTYSAPASGTSTDALFVKRTGALSSGATTTITVQTRVQTQTKSVIVSPNGRIIVQ